MSLICKIWYKSRNLKTLAEHLKRQVNISYSQGKQFSNASANNIFPVTTLTHEEQLFKDNVWKMAHQKILPLAKKMDDEQRFDDRILNILSSNGLMGITVSPKYGGSGSSFFTAILAIEELAKVDCVSAGTCDVQNTVANKIIEKNGTEEQKAKYLPLLVNGHFCSFCLSEPDTGSDAFSMKTKADKQGDYYVINGTKRWITNAIEATTCVVFANVNPSLDYKGVTCFLVDKSTPGLNVTRNFEKLGIRGASFCEVTFDNVKVPETNILGKVGGGYKCAIDVLNEGRIGAAAMMLGAAEGCMDITIPYTLERKQFGQKIFDFQSLQHQIARVATQIECAKLLVYNAARKLDCEQSIIKEASMAKLFSSEVAQLAASSCIDWMGAAGYTKDYPLERMFRDVKAGTIFEGSSNIQLNVIANYIRKEYGKAE